MRLRWLIVGMLVVLGGGAIGLWLTSARLVEWGRVRAEHELAAIFRVPVRIGHVTLSVLPPAVRIEDVRIGAEAPTLVVRTVSGELQLAESVRAARPVVAVTAAGIFFDVDRLPKPSRSEKPSPISVPGRPFPFEITAGRIEDVTVQFAIDHQPIAVTAPLVRGRAGITVLQPYLTLDIDADEAALNRAGRRLAVAPVHIEGGVRADQFYVTTASTSGEHIAVRVINEAPPPNTRHRVTAELPFEVLAVLFEPLKEVAGNVHVDGVLNGELFDPEVAAEVQLNDALFGGLAVGDLQGRLERHGAQVSARDVAVKAWGGTARASFEFNAQGTMPASGEATWRDLDVVRIGRQSPVGDWSILSEGKVALTGTLDPLALMLDANGTLAPRVARSTAGAGEWTAQLGITKEVLQLTGSLRQGPANQTRVTASLTDGTVLAGSATVQLAAVDKLAPLTPAPLREGLGGSVSAAITLDGTLEEPHLAGTVNGDRITLFGAFLPHVAGQLEWTSGAFSAHAVQLVTATGTGEFDGVVALDAHTANDWRLSMHGLDVTPLTSAAEFFGVRVPMRGGTADGTATCRGPWAAPVLDADLQLQHLWLLREPMDEVTVRASGALSSWRADLRVRHARSEWVSVSAAGQGTQQLQATIESSPWELGNLRGAGLHGLSGTVTAHGTVTGALDQLGGSLNLTGGALVVGGQPIGKATVTAAGAAGDWQGQAVLFGETVRLRASLQTREAWPFTLTGEWSQPKIAPLLTRDVSVQIETAGSLTLNGRLTAPRDLSGEVNVPTLTISRQAYRISATEPIVVRGEHGRFRVVSCSVAGTDSRLQVRGAFSTDGQIDLNVSGGGDIALLELLVESIRSARGEFAVAADIGRSEAGEWRLHGSASVTDAAVDVGLPVAFTNTSGSATLAGSSIRIEQLSGKASGGTFRVSGALDLNEGPDLSWVIKEVGLGVADDLEARVSGEGKVDGTWQALKVSGGIQVLNALYDRDIELADLLPWLKEQIAPSPRVAEVRQPRTVQLDLRIYAHDGVFIDNNVAKVEMWLDLQVAGSDQAPTLAGTIGVLSGEVKFRNRTFTITGGTIDFQDRFRINPVLNLNAESQVVTPDAEYTLTVAVSGTAENPRVQFSADDPSLSQNDVLSLASFGKTTAQMQREGGGVSAVDALALLPTRGVEQRVSKFIGIDRFEVEAAQARGTGSIEPRVTIGKDLTDRLRALVSSGFGVQAGRMVQLEYRLTGHLSLLGSWEGQTQVQAGAFGGDIKFRYEFRRLPFSLRGGEAAATAGADAR